MKIYINLFLFFILLIQAQSVSATTYMETLGACDNPNKATAFLKESHMDKVAERVLINFTERDQPELYNVFQNNGRRIYFGISCWYAEKKWKDVLKIDFSDNSHFYVRFKCLAQPLDGTPEITVAQNMDLYIDRNDCKISKFGRQQLAGGAFHQISNADEFDAEIERVKVEMEAEKASCE